ncbi:MAG: hypothetical protein AAFX99_33750, partial [Myxococcota bacterium]
MKRRDTHTPDRFWRAAYGPPRIGGGLVLAFILAQLVGCGGDSDSDPAVSTSNGTSSNGTVGTSNSTGGTSNGTGATSNETTGGTTSD